MKTTGRNDKYELASRNEESGPFDRESSLFCCTLAEKKGAARDCQEVRKEIQSVRQSLGHGLWRYGL